MFKSDGIFSRFMNCLFDILYVGILWIVCSLPVLAAGVYLMPWAVLVIPACICMCCLFRWNGYCIS